MHTHSRKPSIQHFALLVLQQLAAHPSFEHYFIFLEPCFSDISFVLLTHTRMVPVTCAAIMTLRFLTQWRGAGAGPSLGDGMALLNDTRHACSP